MKLISVQSRGDRVVKITEDFIWGFVIVGSQISNELPLWKNKMGRWTHTLEQALEIAARWLEGAKT